MEDRAHPAEPGARLRPTSGHGRGWTELAAAFSLILLAGSWTWWSLDEGAYLQSVPYFNSVLYPALALIATGAAVLVWTAPWRASLALSGPARLGLFGLLALAGWSLASALWSPTPDIAVSDAQRILLYALVFALGIWSCTLLGRRMELAMAPLTVAALIVGVVTAITLAGGENAGDYLDLDGTLEWPLGYRNATAAFFGIALWPALGLASSVRIHPGVRIAAAVTATLCVELAILCQSRGAIIGAVAALAVYLLSAPSRIRGTAWLLIAVVPALAAVPAATAMYDAAKATADLGGVADEMNSAGRIVLLVLPVTAALAAFTLLVDRRLETPRWLTATRSRAILAVGAIVLCIGVVGSVGNPVTWLGDRIEEFSEGEPDLSDASSRFTFNAGSNRSDVWRVAIDAFEDDPVFGDGGGGFQFRYNRERTVPSQLARDAHSIWLELLSELGIVGLALLLAVLAGAYGGALVSRRLGPAAAQLSCAAMAAGAFWLGHSSVDWFWPFPAVSGPPLALLGAAAGPALLLPGRSRPPARTRILLITAMAAVIVTAAIPYLAERLVERSFASFRADTTQAYDDLDLAKKLNPLSDAPYLAEGAIAMELGDDERAVTAYREAADKRPREYAAHFFLALLLAESEPERARAALAVATELNPIAPDLDVVRRQIERTEQRLRRDRRRAGG